MFGLFRRKAVPVAMPSPSYKLAGSGIFDQEVVGESFYQDSLAALCGGHTEDGHYKKVEATLAPDPNNPHDPNAVSVRVGGRLVGYLPKADARRYLDQIAALAPHAPTVCAAEISGGWRRGRGRTIDQGHFGVALNLGWPLRPGRQRSPKV